MCERNERNALAPRMLLEAAPAPWEKKALRRAETAAERFGLRLSPEAYERLGEERRQALRETRRLELGEGILPALMLAFCDSPYLSQDRWEESLAELQSLFYQFKNETWDALPDAELLTAMARVFEAKGGSLTALAMTEPEALLWAAGEARHG